MLRLPDCKKIRLSSDTSIKPFNCGISDLNEFFLVESKDYLSQLLAVTYIFEYEDNTAAFYSVSNDKIQYDEDFVSKTTWNHINRSIPNEKRKVGYPSVKIARFGVNEKYQRNGIGTQLMDSIKMSFITNNKTGCRFITVDALESRAETF